MEPLAKGWKEFLDERPFLARALLFLSAVLVFAPTLHNGFVYDDLPQIIENPFVTNPHMWRWIFTGNIWSFQGAQTNFYRPLQVFLYWALYRVWGANPAPFHLLNLLLVAAAVSVAFEISRRLVIDSRIALLGALIWLIHPAKVEAVAWIASLPDLGAGLFFLLAFLWFLRAEEKESCGFKDIVLPAIFYFIALFFKEMAVTFPLLILVYWFVMGGRDGWKPRIGRWLVYPAALVVYGVVRYRALGYVTVKHHLLLPPLRVIAASFGLLGANTKILIWPSHLNVFRMFDMDANLFSPWPWLALAAIVAAIFLRKRNPALAFLVLWWPVTLLPVLDIRQVSFPDVADRFSFLPSLGPSVAFAYILFSWFPRRVRIRHAVALASLALAIVTAVFLRETLRLIPTWNDNETLEHYSMRQAPNSPLLHMARGMDLEYKYGDLDGALREYNEARRLNMASSWPLGLAPDYYVAIGRIAMRKGETQEGIKDFEHAAELDPRNFYARDALGAVYFPAGNYAKAASYFSQSVKLNPQDLGARFYLGMCDMKLGKYREAAEQFHAARQVDPDYRQAYQAEARALQAAGDPAAAARVRKQIPKS